MTAPNFLISAWAQPVAFFARWKARGVNTLLGAANDTTKEKWEAAAGASGLNFISYPGADVVAESKQPGRIGFMQPDEADGHWNIPGSTITDLQAAYARCKPTGLPMYINLLGSAFDNLAYDGTPHPAKADASKWGHRAGFGGWMAYADVVGFDYHLWTSGRPGAFDITKRLMDRAWEWSDKKPITVYVETCTQGKPIPFTADDYEAQVWNAVNYAAAKGYKLRGIDYFATGVYGGGSWPERFDLTGPDVAARMVTVHAKLAQMFGYTPAPVPVPEPAPTPIPTPDPITARLDAQDARIAALTARLDAMVQAGAPAATQPAK
jgi:hypothetical protein